MELPSTRREDTQRGVEEALKADEKRRAMNSLIAAFSFALAFAVAAWWNGFSWSWVGGAFVFGLVIGHNASKR
jgi:hypothetical protein